MAKFHVGQIVRLRFCLDGQEQHEDKRRLIHREGVIVCVGGDHARYPFCSPESDYIVMFDLPRGCKELQLEAAPPLAEEAEDEIRHHAA